MAQHGVFTTTDVQPGQIKDGLDGAMMYYKSANNAPLLTALGANADHNYRNVRCEWSEAQHITGVNGIVSVHGDPLGCVLSFADTSWVTENTMFMVIRTGEMLLVRAVEGQVVTVERGFGDSDVEAIITNASTDEVIMRIGTAFEEGSERPDPVSMYHMSKFNYNQIFRNTWAVTRTAAMMNYREGDLVPRLKKEALMMHTRDIEMTILFGVKSFSHHNARPRRTMDGLYRQICTNLASPYDGVLTVPMLDDFFERVFSKNPAGKSSDRIALCGMGFFGLINRLARLSGQYEYSASDNYYGQKITKWITPFGEIDLVPHPLMNEIPGYRNDLILLHPDSVELKYLYEAKHDHMGAQGNDGVDAHNGGFITEMTMCLMGELSCGILTGVCDVAGESQPFYLAQPHVSMPNPGC